MTTATMFKQVHFVGDGKKPLNKVFVNIRQPVMKKADPQSAAKFTDNTPGLTGMILIFGFVGLLIWLSLSENGTSFKQLKYNLQRINPVKKIKNFLACTRKKYSIRPMTSIF